MRRALALAFVALCTSCAGDLTELRLEVITDLRVPEELSSVRVTVDARALGGLEQRREVTVEEPAQLPLRFPVVHEGGPHGPLAVSVVGLRDSEIVADQDLTLSFVPGRSVWVRVELSAACRDVRCATDEVCAAGVCRSTSVDDAGAPAADAGLADASGPSCPEARMCVDRCDCAADDCGCALTCREGEDCDVHCDADCSVDANAASDVSVRCHGASCRVEARDASNVEPVRCEDGASCEVDCRGVSNCTVECRSGSRCLVRCAGASNCEIRHCGDLDDDVDEGGDGPLRRCAGDVYVCRRGCP